MKSRIAWSICFALFALSNTAHCFSATRSKFTFNSLQSLKPGVTTKDSLIKQFGTPDETSTTADTEYWRYNEDGYERLGAAVKADTGILVGFRWRVDAGEREQRLASAFALFPEAKWTPEIDEWVHAHYLPDECYFRDHELGVLVHYRMLRKEVSSISRWVPKDVRTVSDLGQKKVPPKFCWSDDERTCSNYTPGKEWQKRFKTCEPEMKQALTSGKN